MADQADQQSESSTPKLNAPKDKNCPFCGQAFTSSSLGRHLDLYIKEKNPKPSDGIHDVDAIRRLRGGITRRQPRGSLGGRDITPSATPSIASAKQRAVTTSYASGDTEMSPAIPRDGQFHVDTRSKYPFGPRWEATGVINEIPKSPYAPETPMDGPRRPGMQRSVSTVSKHLGNKAQFDAKQRLGEALDTARAAELALRELLSSWRAAKQQIDSDSMPFDFDPLSLDFPALALQCLRPPPTLFSSTQHPTSTSWSVQAPGHREYGALQTHFREEFRSWRLTCAVATTASMEELTYPPSHKPPFDSKEAVRRAEMSAEGLEKQVQEHLDCAYGVWDALPDQRRDELWVLELARSVGRKHTETLRMKDEQHKVAQENANLRQQIDDLNRLQQPREFRAMPPALVSFDKDFVNSLYELGDSTKAKMFGLGHEDRHSDLATIVSRSIERWKGVVTANRATNTGMNAQRSLEESEPPTEPIRPSVPPRAQSQARTPQQSERPRPLKRVSTTSTTGPPSEQTATSATTTGPPSVATSDQDADAEMEDDDSFAILSAQTGKPPPQAPLEIPRARPHMTPNQPNQTPNQQQHGADPRFLMTNGAGSPMGRAAMAMSRSMPTMNMAMQGNPMNGNEMSMAMQGVRDTTMYMD